MRRPMCVGLAGGSGAGKSALAAQLALALGSARVLRIAQDAYYRDPGDMTSDELAARNFDHPDALETELLVTHLRELRQGRPVQVPIYDFSRHRRAAETWRADPRELVVVDGILALAHPALRECFDLRVFVDAPESLRLERRLARDVVERGRSPESVRSQFEETVRPMHAAYVEPSRAYADCVLANRTELALAAEPLLTRVRALLG
ncbi:MAG TPA: uridine kinase [Myxococcota bacterium]|nr:uridine kinase [Myxococcota bacterium]